MGKEQVKTQSASQPREPGLVLEPTYGYGDPFPRRPTLKEIAVEWVDAVAFWQDRSRLPAALYVAYHIATFGAFFAAFFSIGSVLVVLGIASLIGTVYNTVWYHRYCTHRAFEFRSIWLARVFLWTNPVCFREEGYVIPHRIHHSRTDEAADPYGPHLGWLGSYLATESQQKLNRQISRTEYDRLAKSLEHIGFPLGSYEQFQRLGSVEPIWHWLARMAMANLLWAWLGFAVAGWRGVLTWLAGVFLYSFLVRDFNYRGHGGYLGGHVPGLPLNQVFYGVIAGEWHENHHAYPRSAKAGLAWWQIDIPFLLIKGLCLCGAVARYNLPPAPGTEPAKISQAESA